MQSIKNIIRKIGAVSAGAAFVGATMMGAMAATLDTYPAPFVSNGAYNSSLAVIHSANGLDQAAAMSVVAGLKTAVTPAVAGTVSVSGDAFLLDKSSNHLSFNDYVSDLHTNLDHSDLRTILKKEDFSDTKGTNSLTTTYTQKLYLYPNTLQLINDRDTLSSNDAMGDYLYVSKSSSASLYLYNFDMDSTDTLANAADIEGVDINVLGKPYTIVDATVSSTGNLTKFVMLAGGAAKGTIVKGGTPLNGVTVTSVSSDGTKCQIEYAGATYLLDKGATKKMSDGTIVGITDVFATGLTGGSDSCEIVVGANKVEIEEGKKVKVNEVEISDTVAHIGNGGFDMWNVTYTPNEKKYLKAGEEYKDPVFGAFKFVFGGVTSESALVDNIKVESTSSSFTLSTPTNGGSLDKFVFCYRNDTNQLLLGEDADNQFVVENGANLSNASVGEGTDITDLEGTRFLYTFGTVANADSHIIEIVDIDTANNETDFIVVDTGTPYTNVDYTPETASAFTFMDNSFSLNISNKYGNIGFTSINDNGGSLYTKNGANITFRTADDMQIAQGVFNASTMYNKLARNCNITVTEGDTTTSKETATRLMADGGNGGLNSSVRIELDYDGTYTKIAASASNLSSSLQKRDKTETYEKMGRSHFGTLIETYDEHKSNDYVYLTYPEKIMYGKVWITPISATVSGGASGTVADPTILKDTDVADASIYNAIVVGGPCANTVAAKLLGVDGTYPTCSANYKSGEATIVMKDNGAKVAMIVAGWEKEETATAAKVLESYKANAANLKGTSVTVTGSVSSPTVVA